MPKQRLLQITVAFCAWMVFVAPTTLLAAGGDVVSDRDGTKVRMANDRISVVLDEADGVWDANWPGSVPAAVHRVGFAVDVDGHALSSQTAKAEVVPFNDAIGSGLQIRQHWGEAIEFQRCIRVYDGKAAVVVAVQITNKTDHNVTLGEARLLDLAPANRGQWRLGTLDCVPAAISYPNEPHLWHPFADGKPSTEAAQAYHSTSILALAQREPHCGMAIGLLSSLKGNPVIDAQFQTGKGGTSLKVAIDTGNLTVPAGQTVLLDPAWLAVETNGYEALERYGDAVAAMATKPVHTGANALWCSWYPIRMGISEDIVLAHAEITAKHFKALGLETMQLDHGWQLGDICGDWFPNERFPHGFKWLSDQLQSRYGLKLGLWIAPTQVAQTSQLFRDHPDWMLKDAQGKPAVQSRWYWEPKPEMYVLDSANPAVVKWIEETFTRLSADGASYYKIDFIAGSPSLYRAMEAIRSGAGPNAWIRYCQTPPLLSVNLANSSYIGIDTGDAGLADWLDLSRQNAPHLAASYWINDRLYHREVCDMSVGMKADVEEARFRLALMTLSGCSISFSDDFRTLDSARIRMMQQCLPPGNPAARPLDLFERDRPSLWHMHCKNTADEWDVVGLFNFEDQPQERTVELASLGLPNDAQVVVFEFWEEKLLGVHKNQVTRSLAPHTARVLVIHRLPTHPQVIATNMHILGGYHEIKQLAWNEKRLLLTGQYQRAAGLAGKAFLYVPDDYSPLTDSPLAKGPSRITNVAENLWAQDVEFKDAQMNWAVGFERTSPATDPGGKPAR